MSKFLVIKVFRSKMSTNLITKLGVQIIASSVTLGILCENYKVIGIETPQHEGSAKDLQLVAEVISQNPPISTEEKEADIEINVIEKLLNEPVFSPFRQEGTVKDSTRPNLCNYGGRNGSTGCENCERST